MKRAAWLAGAAFALVWIPLTVWKGLALGRAFRIGTHGQGATGPLIEGVIQTAAVMLVPALFAALAVFTFAAWREERRQR